MLHLVYTLRPTKQARTNPHAFWDWARERDQWFYDGFDMVEDTKWYVRTIGPDVHSIEHVASFADEAAWGAYRAALHRRSQDPEWEARRISQEQWWEILDARLLNDAPGFPRRRPQPEVTPSTPAQRARRLLDHARFMTLATSGPDGAWASTVNTVTLYRPLRLLWYSLRDARHSTSIAATPQITAAVYLTGLETSAIGLDGAQLSAECHEVPEKDVASYHEQYYRLNFPDPDVRREWMLPANGFSGSGPWRFYVAHVRQFWLFDIDRWLVDKHDTRMELSVDLVDGDSHPE